MAKTRTSLPVKLALFVLPVITVVGFEFKTSDLEQRFVGVLRQASVATRVSDVEKMYSKLSK